MAFHDKTATQVTNIQLERKRLRLNDNILQKHFSTIRLTITQPYYLLDWWPTELQRYIY